VALPNVRLEQGAMVEELIYRQGSVTGVRVMQDGAGSEAAVDLVIDAGGRGSQAPKWLGGMGYPMPAETTIGVDFAYTSTKFRKPEIAAKVEPIMLFGAPPPEVRGAGLFEIEGGIWHVSLAGRFNDYPPTDFAGFIDFARSLPSRLLYQLIKDAERLTDITQHRFPSSILRHYEQMASWPEKFLILGDAICSFNPVYGQGMTSAGLQARALQSILRERAAQGAGLDGLAATYFCKVADVISTPWTLAANFDFAYPQTQGERPPGIEQGARYFLALDALQVRDPDVQRLLVEVFQLMKPLSALWGDAIRERVFALMAQQQA
jgi:2-polyprenyl-6-methoxyphenol hydroxylase-like FAD-dependent oxidoreductase